MLKKKEEIFLYGSPDTIKTTNTEVQKIAMGHDRSLYES